MEIPYKVEYRKVKYPRLEFKGLQLLVILPLEVDEPTKILEKREVWIRRKWNIILETIKKAGAPKGFMVFGETYTIENTAIEKPMINYAERKIYLNYEDHRQYKEILKQLKKLLEVKVKPIIEEYTAKFSLQPNKILIRRHRTKWGSCSDKRNIALNIKLVCLPEQTLRYIIFHEITHLKHKRHNQAFWQTISQEFPNYKEQERKLQEYWFTTELLFRNMTKEFYDEV
jgi:predicted metal-dependent hydrolase